MEIDRHSEALAIAEPSSQDFDLLDLRVHALRAGIGDPVGEERQDVGPTAPQHARLTLVNSVDFAVGYVANLHRVGRESAGAFFFSIQFKDLLE
jgi:hypothetical protein